MGSISYPIYKFALSAWLSFFISIPSIISLFQYASSSAIICVLSKSITCPVSSKWKAIPSFFEVFKIFFLCFFWHQFRCSLHLFFYNGSGLAHIFLWALLAWDGIHCVPFIHISLHALYNIEGDTHVMMRPLLASCQPTLLSYSWLSINFLHVLSLVYVWNFCSYVIISKQKCCFHLNSCTMHCEELF